MNKSFTEKEFNEVIKVYLENKYVYEYWIKHNGVDAVDRWCTHSDADDLNPEFTFYILSEFTKWVKNVKPKK